jgi:predicted MPP superfamily phosphohydrolase
MGDPRRDLFFTKSEGCNFRGLIRLRHRCDRTIFNETTGWRQEWKGSFCRGIALDGWASGYQNNREYPVKIWPVSYRTKRVLDGLVLNKGLIVMKSWRWILPFLVLVGLSFPAQAHFFLRMYEGRPFFYLVKTGYGFGTVWLPVLLALAGVWAFFQWRNAGRNKRMAFASISLLSGAFSCAGVGFYATYIEPHHLVVRQVTTETPKVTGPVRILHMSDIQSARMGGYEERVFAQARALNPDLVLMTGDMLHPIAPATFESEWPKLRQLLQTLSPPGGVWGILGSTDRWMEELTAEEHEGVELLKSRSASVDLPQGRISLFGLPLAESRWPDAEQKPVREWLAQAGTGDFKILLGHAPDFAREAQKLPVDLCLAGHTHGGQIRIPFWGPLVTFSDVPRSWARGYREVGQTRLNVSAGVGCEHAGGLPNIRLNCPPEITLIELRPTR